MIRSSFFFLSKHLNALTLNVEFHKNHNEGEHPMCNSNKMHNELKDLVPQPVKGCYTKPEAGSPLETCGIEWGQSISCGTYSDMMLLRIATRIPITLSFSGFNYLCGLYILCV